MNADHVLSQFIVPALPASLSQSDLRLVDDVTRKRVTIKTPPTTGGIYNSATNKKITITLPAADMIDFSALRLSARVTAPDCTSYICNGAPIIQSVMVKLNGVVISSINQYFGFWNLMMYLYASSESYQKKMAQRMWLWRGPSNASIDSSATVVSNLSSSVLALSGSPVTAGTVANPTSIGQICGLTNNGLLAPDQSSFFYTPYAANNTTTAATQTVPLQLGIPSGPTSTTAQPLAFDVEVPLGLLGITRTGKLFPAFLLRGQPIEFEFTLADAFGQYGAFYTVTCPTISSPTNTVSSPLLPGQAGTPSGVPLDYPCLSLPQGSVYTSAGAISTISTNGLASTTNGGFVVQDVNLVYEIVEVSADYKQGLMEKALTEGYAWALRECHVGQFSVIGSSSMNMLQDTVSKMCDVFFAFKPNNIAYQPDITYPMLLQRLNLQLAGVALPNPSLCGGRTGGTVVEYFMNSCEFFDQTMQALNELEAVTASAGSIGFRSHDYTGGYWGEDSTNKNWIYYGQSLGSSYGATAQYGVVGSQVGPYAITTSSQASGQTGFQQGYSTPLLSNAVTGPANTISSAGNPPTVRAVYNLIAPINGQRYGGAAALSSSVYYPNSLEPPISAKHYNFSSNCQIIGVNLESSLHGMWSGLSTRELGYIQVQFWSEPIVGNTSRATGAQNAANCWWLTSFMAEIVFSAGAVVFNF